MNLRVIQKALIALHDIVWSAAKPESEIQTIFIEVLENKIFRLPYK